MFFWGIFYKDYTFYTKILFFYNERCPKYLKNQFCINIFTFLSVICQNFECNLRIFANFRVKTKKSTGSACTFSKKYFFFGSFNKDYTFYTKKSIFYNERCPKFGKNKFFSIIFTFLNVIRQKFEYNLRIFANFRVKHQKSMDFTCRFSKN